MGTLPLFADPAPAGELNPVGAAPMDMLRLARDYAKAVNLKFFGLVQRPGLFGVAWLAHFVDGAGKPTERTLEHLRNWR
jgi:hypothetical protein